MKKFLIGLASFFAVILFLACLGALFIEVPVYLLFGWIPFLLRTTPETTVDWVSVTSGSLCLFLLAFGLHAFSAWMYRQYHLRRHETPPEQGWKIRWTAGFLGVFVLMFLAGIAAVGTTHQSVWLATSKERLLGSGRERLYEIQSTNNTKQHALAANTWAEQHGNALPPGATFDAYGQPLHGWQTHLLPYIEQQNLYDSLDLRLPWNHPKNEKPSKNRISIYLNPFSPSFQQTSDGYFEIHYASNPLVMGGDRSMKIEDIKDGTANTILLGESQGDFPAWHYPLNWRDPALGINRSLQGFGNPAGRATVVFSMADGSARVISDKISPEVFRALCTPAGGEDPKDW